MAYDPDQTRARILAAAARELADHGPAGARVDRIAVAAEANKQGIYHHFGDKRQLLATVLHRRLEELAEAVPLDPDRIADYAGELFDFHAEHPDLIRLVLWEALTADGSDDDHPQRRDHYDDKVHAMVTAQQCGYVDPGLDPRQTVLAILGIVNWQFAATQVADMILTSGRTSPPSMSERRAFAVEAVRRLMAPTTTCSNQPAAEPE